LVINWNFLLLTSLFVLKVDLDLGNYERFLDLKLTRDNNITTGKIYQVIGCCNPRIDTTITGCILLTEQIVTDVYDKLIDTYPIFFDFLDLREPCNIAYSFSNCFYDSLSLTRKERETILGKQFRCVRQLSE